MLTITIPAVEMWDEKEEQFVYSPETTLELEHSLVSLSKWESKWQKPFLSGKEKTEEEVLDYIKCMTLTPNVSPIIYDHLSEDNITDINRYIDAPMTATTFSDRNNKPSREIITAELIYYWMITANIPFKCEEWHLNRLLTLIKVCGIKNSPPKKMSKREIMSRNASINAARKKQLNTRG
jgi:hypothetical protein|nr:MAG TPA: hypothetical protein [Caudoviricetes sp.]